MRFFVVTPTLEEVQFNITTEYNIHRGTGGTVLQLKEILEKMEGIRTDQIRCLLASSNLNHCLILFYFEFITSS
jgi:hypothetical protein